MKKSLKSPKNTISSGLFYGKIVKYGSKDVKFVS